VEAARVEYELRLRLHAAAQARRESARLRCVAENVPANPVALRELARHRTEMAARRDERQRGREARWRNRLTRNDEQWRDQLATHEEQFREQLATHDEQWRDQLTTNDDQWRREVAAREESHRCDLMVRDAERALATWSSDVTPVGEAEAEVADARAELARLVDLDATLELTSQFLQRARERAHRTIAPVLADTVRQWLPETTAGRYQEVIVDSEHLRVQVRGPADRWRDADRLSHGTAEQVYLMVRIALARHLTRPGTVCPLLLDEVTVHADTARTAALLDLLRRCAEEDGRQIVLFTAQDQVRDWAAERLDDPRHALQTLNALVSA
jgi:uncharacterized protein YhaN